MIKQILFDCGGVLVEMNFKGLMRKISGSQEITEYFIKNIWKPGSPWLLYDKGDINTQEVLERLEAFMPQEYHGYLAAFVRDWLEGLPPIPYMENVVDRLKEKGYGCYLLTNFSERFEEMPKRTPVLAKMDGIVASYQIHMLKPDPAIYLYTAKTLGFKPEETLFVDDSLRNVEGAKQAGMEAYHFTTPEAFEAYLREREIL